MRPPPEEHFGALHAQHARTVLGYALRRADSPEDAADVLAETMLVAWRRLDEVPHEPQTLAWLLGVARRVLANVHRGKRRRGDLGERLRRELPATLPDHAGLVSARRDAEVLMAGLAARDREILLLTAWEELTPTEIAETLAMTPNAVRLRLSRARATLRERAGRHGAAPAGHLQSIPTTEES